MERHRSEKPAGDASSSGVPAELGPTWGTADAATEVEPAVERRAAHVEAFVAQLERLPWFANLGHPLPEDEGVVRLGAWEEWPGPLDPAVLLLSTDQQELFDALMEGSSSPEQARACWERVHQVVFATATGAVPYDPAEDCYHAPTSAVWAAAWTAGLVALCLHEGHRVPAELRQQWAWFTRGHWPAGYASLNEDEEPGPLLVY